ncbi:MAG: S1C family serine protease [Thermoleophilia bacterium]
MKKNLLYIANGAVAGLAGAALFFLCAFSFHWGGIGQSQLMTTIPAADSSASVSQVVSATAGGLNPTQIYQKYADASVQIVSTFSGSGSSLFNSGSSGGKGIGSGFVANAEGYILTNAHVVIDTETSNTPTKASKVEVNFRSGKKAEATIVGYDLTSSDVAVLKVDPSGLALVPAVLGDSGKVVVGEPVAAIGSPFGEYSSSITSGIVSAINRTVQSPSAGFAIQNAIQTDAAINRGNSGGPLFNSSGEVIGLNEQIATTSGGSEGVGFAVPINTAKQVMDQIITNGSVQYAWMGVVGQTLDAQTAKDMNLTVDKGALISDVQTGGPAQAAGLQKNDVIIKIDDQDITRMEDVTGILITRKPGDKVNVTYVRGGDTLKVEFALGTRPAHF